jgi:hypothetical protein
MIAPNAYRCSRAAAICVLTVIGRGLLALRKACKLFP